MCVVLRCVWCSGVCGAQVCGAHVCGAQVCGAHVCYHSRIKSIVPDLTDLTDLTDLRASPTNQSLFWANGRFIGFRVM